MGVNLVNKKAKTIDLKSNTDKEFFLIHGYSGSPTDFNSLPKYLHKKFNANVKVIRLRGHGSKVEDLDYLDEKDFLEQVEEELKKDLSRGRKIVLGGVSFGAQIALYLASKYPVEGVFNVVIPYRFKFPFNIKGLKFLGLFKKYWKKHISEDEKVRREGSFSYDQMHYRGLILAKRMSKRLDKRFGKISYPSITIHSIKDSLGHFNSAKIINKKIGSKIHKVVILDEDTHNLFFSDTNEMLNRIIADFFIELKIFSKQKTEEGVSAVIAAYNEESRIGGVLEALIKSKILKEIIVVDDGSSDDTEKIVRKFKRVKYLRNKKNKGKAYSMDRGVSESKFPVIFFCDADLVGFTPEMVESIAIPVLNREVDMFIGVRNNKMQKLVKAFAINSGERVLRKKLWQKLPDFYKYRYRIECGLNTFVRRHGRGFGYEILPYYQTLKEVKYGFFRGTFLRWRMNLDVFMAFLRFYLFDYFRKFDLN